MASRGNHGVVVTTGHGGEAAIVPLSLAAAAFRGGGRAGSRRGRSGSGGRGRSQPALVGEWEAATSSSSSTGSGNLSGSEHFDQEGDSTDSGNVPADTQMGQDNVSSFSLYELFILCVAIKHRHGGEASDASRHHDWYEHQRGRELAAYRELLQYYRVTDEDRLLMERGIERVRSNQTPSSTSSAGVAAIPSAPGDRREMSLHSRLLQQRSCEHRGPMDPPQPQMSSRAGERPSPPQQTDAPSPSALPEQPFRHHVGVAMSPAMGELGIPWPDNAKGMVFSL